MVRDLFKHAAFLLASVVFLSVLHPPWAYAAVGSPSNAGRPAPDGLDPGQDGDVTGQAPEELPAFDVEAALDDFDKMEGYLEDYYGLSDDETLDLILLYVQQIAGSMSGPGIASPSQADRQEGTEDSPEDEAEDVTVLEMDGSVPYASLSLPDHDVVYISGLFSGDPYTLVIPADTYPYLWVGDDGVLYNVSSDTITGRLFPSGSFDPGDYEYKNLVLAPLLGQSANQVYQNRYLSSLRSYYERNNYITSSTTYGNFYVDQVDIQRSLKVDYRSYYVAVVSLFMLGVIVLCYWKSSRR